MSPNSAPISVDQFTQSLVASIRFSMDLAVGVQLVYIMNKRR